MNLKMYATFSWLIISLSVMAGPTRITDLVCSSTNGGAFISWIAPTPSGSTTLTNLDVRYGTSPITTLNWNSKTRVAWLTDPGTPGTIQNAVVTGLIPGAIYYFAVRVQDSSGSWSTMSNLGFTMIGDSTYSVTLAWDPSPDSAVTHYYTKIGLGSGTYSITNLVGNVTTSRVFDLSWGVTYYFVVTAGDAYLNESDPSNEISYMPPNKKPLPP